MDDEEAELRNPFPSPPSHYKNYTNHNLELLSLLRERVGPETDLSTVNQHEVLSDQQDVPDFPLASLEKPRVDWILEEGHYTVFGDTWYVKETIPSLEELGGHQLYPADPNIDRRPALLAVLRSLLLTYSRLLNALLAPPPTFSDPTPPEWQRYVEWITVLAQNVMAAANDLRPVQARGNLELMMRRQLELRKEETRTIHEKCDALEAKLEEMRLAASQVQAPQASHVLPSQSQPSQLTLVGTLSQATADMTRTLSNASTAVHEEEPSMTSEDVIRWAEEIA